MSRAPKTYFPAHQSPCASCPYRTDVALMYWDRAEYEKLLASTKDMMGILFGCHKYRNRPKNEHVICAGWLLDQRENGTPSIALRLALIDSRATAAYETVTDGGHEVYESTEQLCLENIAAFDLVKKARRR